MLALKVRNDFWSARHIMMWRADCLVTSAPVVPVNWRLCRVCHIRESWGQDREACALLREAVCHSAAEEGAGISWQHTCVSFVCAGFDDLRPRFSRDAQAAKDVYFTEFKRLFEVMLLQSAPAVAESCAARTPKRVLLILGREVHKPRHRGDQGPVREGACQNFRRLEAKQPLQEDVRITIPICLDPSFPGK
jgi:hypothetical protein